MDNAVVVIASLLSLAAWLFWTAMLWNIQTESQQQSKTLLNILAELRKAASNPDEAATTNRLSPWPSEKKTKAETKTEKEREQEREKERVALEAMGFSNDGTTPKSKGIR